MRVATKIPGTLSTLTPEEGDAVTAGQVIARIDTTDLELALATARAERDAADADLRLKLSGARSEEIAEARAVVAQAEADLAGAQRELDRMQGLVDSGSGIVKSRDDAATRRDISAKAVAAARERLHRLEAGSRPQEIDASRARLAAGDARIAQLEQQVKDATIAAPRAGIVTGRLVEPGEILAPGAVLVVITDLERRLADGLRRRARPGPTAPRPGGAGRHRRRPVAHRQGDLRRQPGRVHAQERPDRGGAREAGLPDQGRAPQRRRAVQARHAGHRAPWRGGGARCRRDRLREPRSERPASRRRRPAGRRRPPRAALRRRRRRRRPVVRRAARRDVRADRAGRRGQDDDPAHGAGAARRPRRQRPHARRRPGQGAPAPGTAAGLPLAALLALRRPVGRRERRLLRRRPRGRRLAREARPAARAGAPDAVPRPPGRAPLRRDEAEAGAGLHADPHAGAADPRRADDRRRPGLAARVLEDPRHAAARRADHAPDDAVPGRSGALPARRADRPRPAAGARHPGGAARARRSRDARSDRRAASRGARLARRPARRGRGREFRRAAARHAGGGPVRRPLACCGGAARNALAPTDSASRPSAPSPPPWKTSTSTRSGRLPDDHPFARRAARRPAGRDRCAHRRRRRSSPPLPRPHRTPPRPSASRWPRRSSAPPPPPRGWPRSPRASRPRSPASTRRRPSAGPNRCSPPTSRACRPCRS